MTRPNSRPPIFVPLILVPLAACSVTSPTPEIAFPRSVTSTFGTAPGEGDAVTEAAGDRAPVAPQEQVMAAEEHRSEGYLSVGGGLTLQQTDSSVGIDSDTETISARIGAGFFPEDWLDIGIGNDVFLSSTKVAGQTTSSVANNVGVSANYVWESTPHTSFYAGPNLGLYLSRIKAAGMSKSSTEFSYGFQVGMRHWLSRVSALKVEWRNLWSEQESFGGLTNDVFQSTLIVSFDLSF